MRVGVFNPTFNVYGGGEFVAAVIANTLAQNGHDVVLFCNEKINQFNLKNFFGTSLHPSIKEIINSTFFKPTNGLLAFYQNIFRSYVANLKTDIWIDVFSNCVFPWTKISYIHFPFLNTQNYSLRFPYLKYPHTLQTGALPYVIFEKTLFNPNHKLVISNSKYTENEIKKNSGIKSTVLYPPIPSVFFDNKIKDFEKKEKENLVVTVSRFDPSKGLEKIPYIASLTDNDVHFVIIGRLHTKKTLLSLKNLTEKFGLTDRIHFHSDISRTEMKKILKRAKIYLHTKVGEHFGISIVEGMAMGCVTLAHDSGGIREFVPENLRYQSITEAAEIISREISMWNPQKVVENIQRAEKFREENFSKEFINLFDRYLNKIL
ncbi:MAG: glycosyltransferase [Candidatus Bathyarchaeum tardum]|nr:MAG: glycosyltransferase [Candidatus Bathyarchaeum tardum]